MLLRIVVQQWESGSGMQHHSTEGLGDWVQLGEAIRYGRRKAGLTQIELAEAAGVDRKTISNYERGRVPATAPRIPDGYFQVARVLFWDEAELHRLLHGPAAPAPHTPSGPYVVPAQAAVPTAAAAPRPAREPAPSAVEDPLVLFPAVVRFGRACAALGADPALRDYFEDTAQALLSQAGATGTGGARPELLLAAYRPHGWQAADPGVPSDDAERIKRALEEHAQNGR